MCINPNVWDNVDDNGKREVVTTACGKCWQCLRNRLDDYVGRCLCEKAFSDWTVCVTLTYRDGPDRVRDGAHRIITPVHFQKFIRAIRDANHFVRYFAVGEHGSRSGRAHFHAILFGQGAMPVGWHEGVQSLAQWPHGGALLHLDAGERAIRYTAKYLQKADTRRRWFSISKKPPLGAAFFHAKAERDFALGVIPSSFAYAPPGGSWGRNYFMTGASRRGYLLKLCQLAGSDPIPLGDRKSEWVQKSLEKLDSWLAQHGGPATVDEFFGSWRASMRQFRPDHRKEFPELGAELHRYYSDEKRYADDEEWNW